MAEATADARGEASPRDSGGGLFIYFGALLLLVNFSDPGIGVINIPVSFFLKNRLHLAAHDVAVFRILVAVPVFLAFVFGFLRDHWSPFGRGDRGHVGLFGILTGAAYVAVAFLPPTYAVLLLGVFMAAALYQVVMSAMTAVASVIGEAEAKAGRVSGLLNFTQILPQALAGLAGGLISQWLEGQNALLASRYLFLIVAGLMALVALFGVFGPKTVFDRAARIPSPSKDLGVNLKRLLLHRPLYPVLVIQLLWQFSPATGTVLQFHIVDALHATDAQWGLWNAIFYFSFLPVLVGYGFLCRKVPLKVSLWGGFGLAVFQMVPLLFVRTVGGALVAAGVMGAIGGFAQAAVIDLTIRSCPRGLQGTVMMLVIYSLYTVAVRVGDLFGSEIYDKHGGFFPVVWITIGVYVLILPVLRFIPDRIAASTDA